MFKPGDKVTCINADFSMYPPEKLTLHYKKLPAKDKKYIVRSCDKIEGLNQYRVLLVEIRNSRIRNERGFMFEPGFGHERFAKDLLNNQVDAIEAEFSETETEILVNV